MYYNKEGKEISLQDYAKLFEDWNYKRVKVSKVYNWAISTVWLGLDHSYGENNKPLIFETMVFNEIGDSVDCQRYATLEEAQKGHRKILNDLIHKLKTLSINRELLPGG